MLHGFGFHSVLSGLPASPIQTLKSSFANSSAGENTLDTSQNLKSNWFLFMLSLIFESTLHISVGLNIAISSLQLDFLFLLLSLLYLKYPSTFLGINE